MASSNSQNARSQESDSLEHGRETRLDGPDVSGRGTSADLSESAVRSLLIVDPSPLSLLATAGTFHSAGYACVCARNHAAATQAVSNTAHDAVIMDVGSDAVAAVQWLDQVRRMPQSSNIPAVLIADSSWAGLEMKTERMKVATRCLFKPIDPHSLLAVVDHLLWLPGLGSIQPTHSQRPDRRLDAPSGLASKPRHQEGLKTGSPNTRGWVTL